MKVLPEMKYKGMLLETQMSWKVQEIGEHFYSRQIKKMEKKKEEERTQEVIVLVRSKIKRMCICMYVYN